MDPVVKTVTAAYFSPPLLLQTSWSRRPPLKQRAIMMGEQEAPQAQADDGAQEAGDKLSSVIEVAAEAIPASSSVARQSTVAWKKTLETNKEIHYRAAERRQKINTGHRVYHVRCRTSN